MKAIIWPRLISGAPEAKLCLIAHSPTLTGHASGLSPASSSIIVSMAEPYIPPPPPYQTSQQELDQKVSHVLLASFPIPNAQPGANHTDDYQFDEVPFEAPYGAAARLRESQGASSNSRRSSDQPLGAEKRDHPASQNVQPLRIHKKKPSGSQPKERPSWYTEADLDQGPVFQPLSGPSTPYNETGRRPAELPLPQLLPDHNEDRARAPPPLHASPPFEDVVMAYHGNGSAPPSPLSAPPSPSHSPHPSRPPSRHADRTVSSRSPQPYWSHPHQSLPPPARRVPQRMSPRPTTSYVPPMNTVSQPHMTFDHNVAYTRRGDDTPVPTSEPRAVAFYK